jgi:hypothetical protein
VLESLIFLMPFCRSMALSVQIDSPSIPCEQVEHQFPQKVQLSYFCLIEPFPYTVDFPDFLPM